MKVALDAQLTVGTATGIGEYIRGLSVALRREGLDAIELAQPRFDPWRFDRRVIWDQAILPVRAAQSGATLLHCTAGTVPFISPLPVVVTVHDVAWLAVQAHTRGYARYYFGKFSLQLYHSARRIVVDSEFSRNALLPLLRGFDAQRVHVVYPGVADDFCALADRRSDRRTILAVGTIERRKNLEVLVRALARIADAHLIAVGPHTPYADECAALARRLNVEARVDMPGYVTREQLVALYRSCAVVALPSRYEGFGYPAAQALCAGVPCVVSDQSALPEIVQGGARIVPVDDVAAWSDALLAGIRGDDDVRAAQQRARALAQFSWPVSAQKMIAIYAAAAR